MGFSLDSIGKGVSDTLQKAPGFLTEALKHSSLTAMHALGVGGSVADIGRQVAEKVHDGKESYESYITGEAAKYQEKGASGIIDVIKMPFIALENNRLKVENGIGGKLHEGWNAAVAALGAGDLGHKFWDGLTSAGEFVKDKAVDAWDKLSCNSTLQSAVEAGASALTAAVGATGAGVAEKAVEAAAEKLGLDAAETAVEEPSL